MFYLSIYLHSFKGFQQGATLLFVKLFVRDKTMYIKLIYILNDYKYDYSFFTIKLYVFKFEKY